MNLFTKFLSRKNKNDDLKQLIEHWDALEILVITIFKSKKVTAEDQATFARVVGWFKTSYTKWEARLEPFWVPTLVGGELVPEDPFRRVFDKDSAESYLDDWVAMQNLAAAREALNQFVLNQGN